MSKKGKQERVGERVPLIKFYSVRNRTTKIPTNLLLWETHHPYCNAAFIGVPKERECQSVGGREIREKHYMYVPSHSQFPFPVDFPSSPFPVAHSQ